jgi:hypothetical protein
MHFLAITRRRTESYAEAQFAEVLGPEAERARELYAAAVFREIHSRGDVPGAVIAVEASDLAAARAAVESLPLARAGMMDVQIVPLLPYRGFAAT